MESILVLALVLIVLLIVRYFIIKTTADNTSQKGVDKRFYQYVLRPSLMTRAETEFYRVLADIVQERYVVFPQVHLSALLDHRVKGQNWQYAFRHINGKSVDYVLCDKTTLAPAYVIELDDYTHDTDDRRERDAEVERIFKQANLPLVRFRNYKDLTKGEIITTLAQAKKLAEAGPIDQNRSI